MQQPHGMQLQKALEEFSKMRSNLERDQKRIKGAGKARLDGPELIAECGNVIGKLELAGNLIDAIQTPNDISQHLFQKLVQEIHRDWSAVTEKIQLSDNYA